jgi:DNA-binding transcriptional regulator LsrR (DeoR family)
MVMGTFQLKNSKAMKLTQGDVRMIREMYEQGTTQGALAREFQVSVGQIGRIVRGESRQTDAVKPQATLQELDSLAQKLMQVQTVRDMEVDEPPPTGLAKLAAAAAEHFKGDGMVRELESVPASVKERAKAYGAENLE